MYLVDTLNLGDTVDDLLELIGRMDLELKGTLHYLVIGLGGDVCERKLHLVCDAIDDVHQQMVAVDSDNVHTNRIEEALVLVEIHGNNIITALRCKTYGNLAVAAVQSDVALGILETNHLITRQRTTLLTAVILELALFVEGAVYVRFCLECGYIVEPVLLWQYRIVTTNLHHITAFKLGL